MKEFRIVKVSDNPNPNVLRYQLEQRYRFLYFIRWWMSPNFAPPHIFKTTNEAFLCAKEHFPKCVVYDTCSNESTNKDGRRKI